MEILFKLQWKAINVTANMAIHISHVNTHNNKKAMYMRADRLLAATPSESDPKQTDVA